MRMSMIRLVVLSVLAVLLFSLPAYAAIQNDEVTSAKIREADGASGQNTNSGSGVKTGHIQDGAITSSKIVSSAVTTAKIADGAVTDAKITGPISGSKLGAHTHSGADITDGTVTPAKIQDGAVTDVKISGIISGSKLGSHMHNGSDIVDGTVSTSKIADGAVTGAKISMGTIGIERLAPPANTKIVHTGPVDNINTFNSINAAINALGSYGGGIVKIMPGTYVEDLGDVSSSITIEGSGPERTIVQGNTLDHWYTNSILKLRNLTVTFAYVNGQYGVDAANVVFNAEVISLYQLNVKDSTINGNVYIGNFYGFANSSIVNSTINGGFQINNTRSAYDPNTSVLIKNVTIAGSNSGALYGISLYLRNARVVDSSINGLNVGIMVGGAAAKLEVVGSTVSGATALANNGGVSFYAANSQMSGVIGEGSPTVFKIVHCYDSDYNPIPNR
jgi:hypothetical protein